MSAPRPQKAVLISPELIQSWLTHGTPATVPVDGLPEGAAFVRGFFDPFRMVFGLVFEHPDWPLVDPYGVIPDFTPTLRRADEAPTGDA